MRAFRRLFTFIPVCLIVLTAQAERLVLVGTSYGKNILAITDASGEVLWSHKTAGPQRGHAGHHDVHLLPNGNTMIVESRIGRVIEVNKKGKLVYQFPLKPGDTTKTRWARHTPIGTLLVCSEQPGVVTEYDRNGKVVWDYLIKTRVYGAIRLKNGNTLIASGSGKSVVEVSPEKKVVWEIKGQVPETEIGLGWMTCLQELENGNRIIGNCHAGDKNPQIFEITKGKKVTRP